MNDGDIMVNMDANMRMRMSDWCARLRNVERSSSSRRNMIIWSHCQHCQHFCVKKSKIGESCLKFGKYSDGGFREESIILAYYLRTRHQKPFLSKWKFDCLTMSEHGNVFWGIWLFREFRSKSIEITASWRDAEQLEACYYTMTRQAMCWKSWNLIIKSMNHKCSNFYQAMAKFFDSIYKACWKITPKSPWRGLIDHSHVVVNYLKLCQRTFFGVSQGVKKKRS